MYIPFVDLKAQYNSIKTEIDAAIGNVINETAFIGGKYVDSFENQFAALYGVKNCISCANGTDSLYIIMKMLGIGAGDEVITAANSWISSSETITQAGAKPVFADADSYFTMQPTHIEQLITSKTKAIIAVHLYGQMCDMDALVEICNKHQVHLIEDCAQSHFSEYNGRRAGTFGIAASFSFYPGKNLGAYGDAGCMITNDDELAKKLKMYARHGALKKHQHEIEGINSRLDGLQAAILSAKLPHILNWTAARRNVAAAYDILLGQVPQIKIPVVREQTLHSFHLYVILAEKRDGLMAFLKAAGIETAIHYPAPLPFLPAYRYLEANPANFPVVAANTGKILSLPIYPEITDKQIKFIADTIKQFYA
ncbi:MAG: DegT/DnrJ/EryC1/StrS family aminotransferase [Bacteroidota bacterium]